MRKVLQTKRREDGGAAEVEGWRACGLRGKELAGPWAVDCGLGGRPGRPGGERVVMQE